MPVLPLTTESPSFRHQSFFIHYQVIQSKKRRKITSQNWLNMIGRQLSVLSLNTVQTEFGFLCWSWSSQIADIRINIVHTHSVNQPKARLSCFQNVSTQCSMDSIVYKMDGRVFALLPIPCRRQYRFPALLSQREATCSFPSVFHLSSPSVVHWSCPAFSDVAIKDFDHHNHPLLFLVVTFYIFWHSLRYVNSSTLTPAARVGWKIKEKNACVGLGPGLYQKLDHYWWSWFQLMTSQGFLYLDLSLKITIVIIERTAELVVVQPLLLPLSRYHSSCDLGCAFKKYYKYCSCATSSSTSAIFFIEDKLHHISISRQKLSRLFFQ